METLSIFDLRHWGQSELVVAAIVVSLASLLFSSISWLREKSQARGYRLPPGPRGWPLAGALPYVATGTYHHRTFFKLSQKYGPLMYLQLGTVPAVVISNGEMAKEVLQTHDQILASKPGMIFGSYMTYGRQDVGFAPYGPYWKLVRKIVNLQLLTASKIRHFMDLIGGEIVSTVHLVLEHKEAEGQDDGVVNISTLLNGLTMNVVTQMMWNKRHRNIKGSGSRSDDQFTQLVKRTMQMAGSNNMADFVPDSFKPFAMKLSGLDKKMKDVHTQFDEFFEKILCEKERIVSKDMQTTADEDDFVVVLLKLLNQQEISDSLTRSSVKAILTDMVVGGTDTSSATMDWTLAELLRHPDMMKKVQDELTAVVGNDRLVSEADIPNLKYLDAVIKEILRHHGPAPLGIHWSQGRCRVGGYDIPADCQIFINLFAIHHDSAIWENPWEFNPDRFFLANQSINFKGQNFQYIPFGSGRRMCPGMNLADRVVHLGLAQLLHCVDWSLPKGQGPESVDMSETPGGLVHSRAVPMFVSTKPRLAHDVIYSGKA